LTTFRIRRYVVIATKAVHRANSPNSAQLEGILYHFANLQVTSGSVQ